MCKEVSLLQKEIIGIRHFIFNQEEMLVVDYIGKVANDYKEELLKRNHNNKDYVSISKLNVAAPASEFNIYNKAIITIADLKHLQLYYEELARRKDM